MTQYNSQKEFYEDLATRTTYRRIDDHLMVWFYRQLNGTIEISATFHAVRGSFFQKLFEKPNCHPAFAWGIYQLLSNEDFIGR